MSKKILLASIVLASLALQPGLPRVRLVARS
jgi:hypothetical protein